MGDERKEHCIQHVRKHKTSLRTGWLLLPLEVEAGVVVDKDTYIQQEDEKYLQ